jgi:hypothetical protein
VIDALVQALIALLTVWITPDGKHVLVAHARRAGGQDYVTELARGTLEAAEAHEIDPYLLVALAHEESGLSRYAVQRNTRAWGLYQLHPRSRWYRHARKACDKSPSQCVRAQLEHGARAFRYALDACRLSEIHGVFFHRSGRCAVERARDRRVLVLRDRLRSQGESGT